MPLVSVPLLLEFGVLALIVPVRPIIEPPEQGFDLALNLEVDVSQQPGCSPVEVSALLPARIGDEREAVAIGRQPFGGIHQRPPCGIDDGGGPPGVTVPVGLGSDGRHQRVDTRLSRRRSALSRVGPSTEEGGSRMDGEDLQRPLAVRVKESRQAGAVPVELCEGAIGVGQELVDRAVIDEILAAVEDEQHRRPPPSHLGQRRGGLALLRVAGRHPDDEIGLAGCVEGHLAVLVPVQRPDSRCVDHYDVRAARHRHCDDRPGEALRTVAYRRDIRTCQVAEQCALAGLRTAEEDHPQGFVRPGERACRLAQHLGDPLEVGLHYGARLVGGWVVPISAAPRDVIQQGAHLTVRISKHPLGRSRGIG